MTNSSRAVVVTTSFAPYLGGPATWAPLRAALGEGYAVHVVDTYAFVDAPDFFAATRDAIAARVAILRPAAVVAHGFAAGAALEAVAQTDPAVGVVLVSPLAVPDRRRVHALRWVAVSRVGRALIGVMGDAKGRKLRGNRATVKKQLRPLLADLSDYEGIVDEAMARLADPRLERLARRAADSVAAMLRPVDPSIESRLRVRRIALEAKSPRALMIEEPERVAAAVRELAGD